MRGQPKNLSARFSEMRGPKSGDAIGPRFKVRSTVLLLSDVGFEPLLENAAICSNGRCCEREAKQLSLASRLVIPFETRRLF